MRMGTLTNGGDFTKLDEVVYDADDPTDFFNFEALLPDPAKGGQSIYSGANGPYFADESFVIPHDQPGLLTMYNAGTPNTNGSQFMITFRDKGDALDGTHVAFGQVIEGWDVLAAMVGRCRFTPEFCS